MTELRKQFKATSVQKLNEQENEVKQFLPQNTFTKRNFISLEAGDNKLRIYPARGENESFLYLKSCYFLPFEVLEKDDNGKEIPKLKNKPIFNSLIHGKTQKDLVDEYIKLATELLTERSKDPEHLRKSLNILNGYKDQKGTYHAGIKPVNKWVFYCDKITIKGKEFGLCEVTNGVKEKMSKLTIIEDIVDAIVVDPFTDPDEGICLILNYNPNAQKTSDFYSCSLEQKQRDKFNFALVPTPLTDEELEYFMTQDSLKKLFEESYTKRDFNLAFQGLEYFDKKNQIGVFQLPVWEKIVDEISQYYPEIEVEETQSEEKIKSETSFKSQQNSSVNKVETREEENEIVNDYDLDSLNREELIQFIQVNNLSVKVKDTHSEASIRILIEAAIEGLEEEKPIKQELSVKQPEKTEIKITSTSTTPGSRLSALRAKQ